MTATKGLGTYGEAVGVVTPLDHKMAQLGLIVKTAANTIRPGLFWDGNTTVVSGTANMSYNVRAFSAVTSRGATAGAVLLTNDGTYNVATTAAPGSNSRYDVVYVWPREYSLDGTDSNPVIGVEHGTAAAVPSVPSLAAFPGAIELARILVPAGVTATNSGTTITQRAPFTATAGGVIPFRSTTERDEGTYLEGQLGWLIDTNRMIAYDGSTWGSLSPSSVMVPSSVTGGTVGPTGAFSSSSVALVRANGVFSSVYSRYKVKFDITTASSTTVNVLLSAAGTDTTTGYDNQRLSIINGTATAAQSLGGGAGQIITGGGVASTRHVGTLYFDTNPATTGDTYFHIDTTISPNPMTTAHGKYLGSGLQRATTQFDGLSFAAATGNLTVNYCSVVGCV